MVYLTPYLRQKHTRRATKAKQRGQQLRVGRLGWSRRASQSRGLVFVQGPGKSEGLPHLPSGPGVTHAAICFHLQTGCVCLLCAGPGVWLCRERGGWTRFPTTTVGYSTPGARDSDSLASGLDLRSLDSISLSR